MTFTPKVEDAAVTAAFEGLPLLQAARAKARSAAEPKLEAVLT